MNRIRSQLRNLQPRPWPLIVFVGGFGVLCALTALAGQPQSLEKRDLLASTLRFDVDLDHDCLDAVTTVFSAVDAGGGIIVSAPTAAQAQVKTALHRGARFSDALKQIAQYCAVQWVSTRGSVDVTVGVRPPALLKTPIDSFQWDLSAQLTVTLERLMATEAVQSGVARLHLTERPKMGGPSLLTPTPAVATHAARSIANMSLCDTLNAVTRSYGNAVWTYREDTHTRRSRYVMEVAVERP